MKFANKIALEHTVRRLDPGTRLVGAPDPHEVIEVSVVLKPRKPIPDAIESGKRLPSERKYRTREDYAKEYGADPTVMETVMEFAHAHQLTVIKASVARRTIELSGTVQAMSEAFGVFLGLYEREGERFRGRRGAVHVASEFAKDVAGVFGLDNRRQARPFIKRGHQRVRKAEALNSTSYFAPRVASLYQCDGLQATGEGETIAILEFGGGYTTQDLQTYFATVSPNQMPVVKAISVGGHSNRPGVDQDSDGEVALDIEVAGAIAPNATIAVYFSTFTEKGWTDAITSAIHDADLKPSVISISWGWEEGLGIWSQQAMDVVSAHFQDAANLGVTVCAAAGDNGSSDGNRDGLAHCDFPASSPFALACGGTKLTGTDRIISETVWNDGDGSAGGGGVSDYFDPATAPWQVNANVPPSINPPGTKRGRGVPDVASNADPESGFKIYVGGAWQVIGGTSAAAPLWAAVIALLNQKLGPGHEVGYLNPVLYTTLGPAKVLRDITQGNIGGYSAKVGWDCCTGWGSPVGVNLLQALAPTHAAAHQRQTK